MDSQEVDLAVQFGALQLPNPLTVAAGCAGSGRELARFVPLDALGSVTTATLMADPRPGLPGYRMAATPSGVLSANGLPGPGIAHFVEHELPWLAERGARVLVSIAGESLEQFAVAAAQLPAHPAVIGLELNLSCPTGLPFAVSPIAAYDVVHAVRKAVGAALSVFAKLPPDRACVVEVGAACVQAGADGLSMIHPPGGMAIDPDTLRPALAAGLGGLSGPAIRPIALRCVHQAYAAMLAGRIPPVPIIGIGGIRTGRDALEFALAGASGVAVGSALFNDPTAPLRILDELRGELAARGFAKFTDTVGLAHHPLSNGRTP